MAVGAKAKAKDLGYDIKIIESSRDQAEQDSQVQQELASGEEVAGFIWWPYVNAAGTGSLRTLSQTGKPVIFTNQYPIEGTENSGRPTPASRLPERQNGGANVARRLRQVDDRQMRQGHDLHLPGGLFCRTDRAKAFTEAVEGKLKLSSKSRLHVAGGLQGRLAADPAEGRDHLGLYGERYVGAGVIQALKENGKIPGKDVLVVGGTCHGDTT